MGQEKVYSLTTKEAAKRAGVNYETIQRWARSGRIDARKNIAGWWYFNEDDIDSVPVREVVA